MDNSWRTTDIDIWEMEEYPEDSTLVYAIGDSVFYGRLGDMEDELYRLWKLNTDEEFTGENLERFAQMHEDYFIDFFLENSSCEEMM